MSYEDFYSDPTVTLTMTQSSAAVSASTGLFAIWARPGDRLMLRGFAFVIASIESNTEFTLAQTWPEADETVSGWVIDRGARWGSNVAIHADVVEILQRIRSGVPFRPDAAGTMADRASYDDAAKGFIFQRIDVLPFELYVKASEAAGDWAGPETLQGPIGEQGFKGWSPIWAVISDGERRVMQVVNWSGGGGAKPTSGLYVGAGGLVDDIADAVDIRGPIGDVTEEVKNLATAAETSATNAAESASSARDAAEAAETSALEAAASASAIDPSTYAWRDSNGSDFSDKDEVLVNIGGGETGISLFKSATIDAAKEILGPFDNSDLSEMPADTLKGRTSTSGTSQDLSGSDAWAKIISPAGKVNQDQAEAGTDDSKFMTPLKTKQYINARHNTYSAYGNFVGDIPTYPDMETACSITFVAKTSSVLITGFVSWFYNGNPGTSNISAIYVKLYDRFNNIKASQNMNTGLPVNQQGGGGTISYLENTLIIGETYRATIETTKIQVYGPVQRADARLGVVLI